MGVTATVGLLFSAVSKAQTFVYVFALVYTLLIFVYILSSWLRLPYSPWLNRIQRFLTTSPSPICGSSGAYSRRWARSISRRSWR
jgi:hypothetical protein